MQSFSDYHFFRSVIESCCMSDDLDAWKTRDDTPVGDSGVTLSGGQRIRLTLARAVYQNYNVYFLDDIFSAVDYKVAHHLYTKCVMGLLRDKTRIVCTHHVRFLQDADWILVMDKGKVVSQGLPKDILPKYLESSELEDSIDQELSTSTATIRKKSILSGSSFNTEEGDEENNSSAAIMNASSVSFELRNENDLWKSIEFNKEHQEEGTIRFSVYFSYYKAVGRGICWLILGSLTAMQASRNLNDLWLAHWVHETGNANSTIPNSSTPVTPLPSPTFESPRQDYNEYDDGGQRTEDNILNNDEKTYQFASIALLVSQTPLMSGLDPDVKYYFSILVVIGIANSIFTLMRAFLFAFGGIRGALRIHSALLNSVLKVKTFQKKIMKGKKY